MPSPEPQSSSSLPTVPRSYIPLDSSPPLFDFDLSCEMSDGNDEMVLSEPAGHVVEPNAAQTTIKRSASDNTEQPPSAQRMQINVQKPIESEGEEQDEDEEEDVNPGEQIDDFDWDKLYQSYHTAFDQATGKEAELLREFAELMTYFKTWAEAGHNHESDRSVLRLRTRMAYVRNSEERLEKTRQHYIGVVKAFEGALALLQSNGFGS